MVPIGADAIADVSKLLSLMQYSRFSISPVHAPLEKHVLLLPRTASLILWLALGSAMLRYARPKRICFAENEMP